MPANLPQQEWEASEAVTHDTPPVFQGQNMKQVLRERGCEIRPAQLCLIWLWQGGKTESLYVNYHNAGRDRKLFYFSLWNVLRRLSAKALCHNVKGDVFHEGVYTYTLHHTKTKTFDTIAGYHNSLHNTFMEINNNTIISKVTVFLHIRNSWILQIPYLFVS